MEWEGKMVLDMVLDGAMVLNIVLDFIFNEFLTNGSHIGYRIIHQRLRTNNIFVDRETVRVALKLLNQEEVALRQAHQFHRQKYVVKDPNQ